MFLTLKQKVWMYILIYLLGINLVGFLSMLFDKHRARRNAWRIPEATLFLFAIFGGSVGSLIGMYTFRHKTMKPKFFIGIPVILGIQVLLVLYFLFLSGFSFRIM